MFAWLGMPKAAQGDIPPSELRRGQLLTHPVTTKGAEAVTGRFVEAIVLPTVPTRNPVTMQPGRPQFAIQSHSVRIQIAFRSHLYGIRMR
jgi:hypothetical protein